LFFLGRIGAFQRVTANPSKKISSFRPRLVPVVNGAARRRDPESRHRTRAGPHSSSRDILVRISLFGKTMLTDRRSRRNRQPRQTPGDAARHLLFQRPMILMTAPSARFVEGAPCWTSTPRNGSAWTVFSPLTGSLKLMFAVPTSSWRQRSIPSLDSSQGRRQKTLLPASR
jgi:hypothetical protein